MSEMAQVALLAAHWLDNDGFCDACGRWVTLCVARVILAERDRLREALEIIALEDNPQGAVARQSLAATPTAAQVPD